MTGTMALACGLLLGNAAGSWAQEGRLHLQPGQRVEQVDLFNNQDAIDNPATSFIAVESEGDAPNPQRVRMRVDAIFGTAAARFHKLVYFCALRPSQTDCDSFGSPEPLPAQDLPVTITFDWGALAQLWSFGVSSSSHLVIEARLRDARHGPTIAVQRLVDETSTSGFKTLARFPIPIPGLEGVEQSAQGVIQATIRRGRLYAFQFTVFGEATSYFVPVGASRSHVNLRGLVPLASFQENGSAWIENVAIEIGGDATSVNARLDAIERQLSSLQAQIGALADVIGVLPTRIAESAASLRQELATAVAAIELQPGPPGPMGPEGPPGPVGPTALAPVGSLLMLPREAPAPPGYTFLGTEVLTLRGPNDRPHPPHWRPTVIVVAVYRKD